MKGLYKGRYLIAVYDNNDRLVAVGMNVKEFSKWNEKALLSQCSHILHNRRTSHKIYLIDCLEEHDDIFANEDKDFIKFLNDNNYKHNNVENRTTESEKVYG